MSSSIKSYFECKEIDLSDISTNEEERKKAREQFGFMVKQRNK